jgi:cold-inducible RNA-binding protein
MTKKLYVGNFSYNTTEAQLRTLFSQVGQVDNVSLITDRDTGRSKGFGFVEMNTEEASREAITRFNGYTLDDRTLTVNEARPREERSGGSFGGGRSNDRYSGGGNRSNNTYTGNRKRF